MKNLSELKKYLQYWYVFLLTVGLSLTAAYFYLQTTPAKYRVSSTLLIEDDPKGDGMFKGTAFSDLEMFKSNKTVESEMEVLRSRDLLKKVLHDLPLHTSYFVKRQFKTLELYGDNLPVNISIDTLSTPTFSRNFSIEILDRYSFAWTDNDKTTIYDFGDMITTPAYRITVQRGPAFRKEVGNIIAIKFNNVDRMAESYSKSRLSILPIAKDANTIVLSLVDAVPERAVDILTRLIQTYNTENIYNKSQMARNTIKFIDERLDYLSTDLSSVEKDVEDYKQVNQIVDVNADAQMNMQSSGIYEQQLAESRVQLEIIRSLETYLRKADNNSALVPSTLGIKDATLEGLTMKYNELQLEKQRLLRSARPNNPLIVNLNEQLLSLKLNMQENLKNVKRGLLHQVNNLSAKSSQFESRIREVPAIERGLLERNREQGVKLSLYHYLLQKREETALYMSSTIPTSQVIDRPAAASIPESPKGDLIYLCSFLFGLILPAGVIYCKHLLNTKVQEAGDLKFIKEANVLGELANKGKQGTVVVQKESRTTISELFRYIRNNLSMMDHDGRNQVLLITSSMKGEGKTFFSINLGVTLSLVNKKVVLLEFDLRKPDLLKGINLNSKQGITDYLRKDLVLNELIHPSGLSPNLYAIGCGTLPEDPAELLLNPKLRLMFERLRQQFDYVIVDTSPVGQVADAFSLAPFTDASIYLVRYNFTNKMQLHILEDIYENKKLKKPLVVFNDARRNKNAYTYGYGSEYGY
ncbi:polysaccharide biosynthesis tyrosine autokinase [Pedobacter sp. SYSU D00535]|uniref:GumC family protein n=1 Tax=Pedobacter sp. SYSU D00535 TaxID=2810308 RepID=UPI001A972061|nr:polysaccharide biosynthesis tyrosine autokinase [Pedobacter sp. SYSU D00535]